MRLARALLVALALGLLVVQVAADVQQRPFRIGILWGNVGWLGASPFELELGRLGYVKGKDFVLEQRDGLDRFERMRGLGAELVRLGPDVILADGPKAVRAVKEATRLIPIVMVGVDDPVGLGFVSSLARPGGNITGLSSLVPGEFYAKQLQLLTETVPQASRIAVLTNPTNPAHGPTVSRELMPAAEALRLKLRILEARDAMELANAFNAAMRERAEALLVLGDPFFVANSSQIAILAGQTRLPAMYLFEEVVTRLGGLMSYGPSRYALLRRAAHYVDKILKGAKPADLPVEQPTRFPLIINLNAAKALGLTIPQSVLIRADQLIQ